MQPQTQNQQSQLDVNYLLESLKQQRNDVTDALAIQTARVGQISTQLAELSGNLNDPDFLRERLAALISEEAEEAPPPKPRAKAKA